MQPVPTTERDTLRARAAALNLHGLLTHWGEVASEPWVASLLGWEEQERARRSLERRLRTAHIGRFKPLCDFDWAWPKRCDRAAIDTLMTLEFLNDAANVVLVGPNGVGKSMIAQNIAHQALTRGPHRAVHQRRPVARRSLRTRQRFRSASPPAPLRPPAPAGDRRGRLPLLLQSPCRSDVRADLAAVSEQEHPGHHQSHTSPNGARCSPTPPASSRWSTVSCTTPRSSPSKAIPIASRKPTIAPNSAPASAAAPNHEHATGPTTAAGASASAHRRDPPLLDTGGGACSVRTDRRSARQDLGSLQPSTTGSASRAMRTPSRGWRRRRPSIIARPEPRCSPAEPSGSRQDPDQKSSCCSIKTAIPSSRPAHRAPTRAAAVKDGRRPPRSGASRP